MNNNVINVENMFIASMGQTSKALDFDRGYDRGLSGKQPQDFNNNQYAKGYKLGLKCRGAKNV